METTLLVACEPAYDSGIADQPRIIADFNDSGRFFAPDGNDVGRVYLSSDSLAEIARAGIKLRHGMTLTVSDFDGDPDGNPVWLMATGIVGYSDEAHRWYVEYPWEERWWEPRDSET